jgi:hypothetical protein
MPIMARLDGSASVLAGGFGGGGGGGAAGLTVGGGGAAEAVAVAEAVAEGAADALADAFALADPGFLYPHPTLGAGPWSVCASARGPTKATTPSTANALTWLMLGVNHETSLGRNQSLL